MTALLRVRRPSGRLATFEATNLEHYDGILWATGRWRERVGLNHADVSHGASGIYGFRGAEVVEVRVQGAADAA
jgi:hypothetical protein